jgi:predicted  nucleic acid-binding Zn-ribbon protein
VITKYELQSEKQSKKIKDLKGENTDLKKSMKKMTSELTDLRVNIDEKIKKKSEESSDVKLKLRETKAKLREVEADKKELEMGYKQEISKMMQLHNQALNMLKNENEILDKRFDGEMQRRKEE